MKIRKFPVISELGEYMVQIEENYFVLTSYDVRVLKPYHKTNIFRKKRVEWRVVWNSDFYASQHGFDFVSMAKEAVTRYEMKVKKSEEREKLVSENLSKFKKWDGVING